MLYARINNVDYDIIDGNINFELDAISEFDVTIRLRDIKYITLLYTPIEIYYDGNLLISGYVDKRPVVKVTDKNALTVNLNCVNELGRLACTKARRNRHYQNQTLSVILADLIAVVPGWVLDTTTLTTGSETLTIDLRSKETLFAQITEVITSVPDTHFRYGGIDGSGNYIFEVGNFNDITTYANIGFNLIDIELQPQENRFYQIIEGYGGICDTGVIRLNRAAVDARYLASPYLAQFPISNPAADNSWIVTNNAATSLVDCSVRKSFSLIKTKNDVVPTAAELTDASYMLYLKCVRFLKESLPSNFYNLRITNGSIPNVGDRVQIFAKIEEDFYDDITGSLSDPIEIFTVNDDYRMTRISLNLAEIVDAIYDNQSNSNEYVLNITASENDELGFFDAELDVYEELEKKLQANYNPA